MKSVQWLQNVGCLKKRAVNWWSFTSTILLCLSAPLLWNTGTLAGGERGEGSGETPGEVADAGEASVNGAREGGGDTGMDMLPERYSIKGRRGGWMRVSEEGIVTIQAKDLEQGRGEGRKQ